MKALNIRDYQNDPQFRQIVGLFKHLAYEKGISQADMLKLLYTKSLQEIKTAYDFHKGNVVEVNIGNIKTK